MRASPERPRLTLAAAARRRGALAARRRAHRRLAGGRAAARALARDRRARSPAGPPSTWRAGLAKARDERLRGARDHARHAGRRARRDARDRPGYARERGADPRVGRPGRCARRLGRRVPHARGGRRGDAPHLEHRRRPPGHAAAAGDVAEEAGKDMAKKVENDTAAFARSVAAARGRNADWAEKAVRESISVTGTRR